MSRRPQQQTPLDTNQPEIPEDELLSATGEGDEVMEEAEEQEGYSACVTLSHWRSVFMSSLPSHPTDHMLCYVTIQLARHLSRFTSVVNPYVFLDMD